MIQQVYKNCILTHEESKVVKGFDPITHPSIILEGQYIFSPCYGIVVQVCKYNSDNLYRVIIQYNGYISLAFYDLEFVAVKVGEEVYLDSYIGKSYSRYNQFGFELLLYNLYDNPPTPFKVVVSQNLELYKSDPRPILDGRFEFQIPDNLGEE